MQLKVVEKYRKLNNELFVWLEPPSDFPEMIVGDEVPCGK
jgi:hypothetical protein